MLKKKLSPSDYWIIAANLLPVAGVFLWNWNPLQVFMVYALETIVAGIFTLIRMGIVTAIRKSDTWYNDGNRSKQSGFFFMIFFIMHYGLFVLIQTGLFISVSGIGSKYKIGFFDFLLHWPDYIGPDAWYMLLGFVLSYGFSLFWNFIRTREYQTAPLALLMFQPYGRIFVQQVTVIFGSMFLQFGAGKIFILIFAAIKILFEVYINYNRLLEKTAKDLQEKNNY